MPNSTQFPILNPNNSLSYLPPGIAVQTEVYRYIVVSAAAAYGWELLSSTRANYRLLFHYRLSAATIAYFVSIIATTIFVFACLVFHIAPADSCETVKVVLDTSYPIAIPASSFLFLLRVRAIFAAEAAIQWFFSILWLGVLGSALTFSFALNAAHIGPTNYCTNTHTQPFASAGQIAATVYDSLVFLAISWRLSSNSMKGSTPRERMSAFFGGKALPALSRGLLQGGQVYYLISVCGHVTSIAMLTTSSVPPLYHAVLTTPIAALMNAMACRVFRDIKFGVYMEEISMTLPFAAVRPTSLSSPSCSCRCRQQPEVHIGDERSRSITQIVFHPEPLESFKIDSMWDSASNKHEV